MPAVVLLIIASAFQTLRQISASSYVGAVVEHSTFVGTKSVSDPKSILSTNLQMYENIIEVAKKQMANILVFPEFGLLPDTSTRESIFPYAEQIPEMNENVIPCDNMVEFSQRPILYRMSCAAILNKISVLINTVDLVPCNTSIDENCPYDNHYQYNTDIVFDELGMVAAKYHKSHEWPGNESTPTTLDLKN